MRTLEPAFTRKNGRAVYTRVLPAYWLNPDARIKALYALMETRYVDDFESSLKATLTLSSELDRALEHATSMLYGEMLELEYDERHKIEE